MTYQFSIHVKGSAKIPYEIKVYNGTEGAHFRCSCPAGKKGNVFCKHIASIIHGDITNISSGMEYLQKLSKLKISEDLKNKALHHKPVQKIKKGKFKSLKEAYDFYIEKFREMNVHCEFYEANDPEGTKEIRIYAKTKTGAIKRYPDFRLTYVEFISVDYDFENNETRPREWREAQLKFKYKNKKTGIDIKRKYIDEPLNKFLEDVGNYFHKTLQENPNL